MGERILELFDEGFSLEEICENFLVKGTALSADIDSIKKASQTKNPLVPYDPISVGRLVKSWFGMTPQEMEVNSLKPILFHLARAGFITKEDIKQAFYFRKKGESSSLNLATQWLIDRTLACDIEILIREGLSKREIGVELGLLGSGGVSQSEFRRFTGRLEGLLLRIYGCSFTELKNFFNTNNLFFSSYSGYFH